ncbi:MAG: carbohydrate ABC transporter permease [Clostridia bacterium]|nr:carbohydrate ABC transporter permease [Clostridia bacterium]
MLNTRRKKIKKKRNVDDVARRNPMHKAHLIALCVFFCFYAFLILFPYLWVLANSFKNGYEEFVMNPMGLPERFIFDNYLAIFRLEDFSVIRMFSNSLLLCFVCPTLACVSCVTAGYVMAKYKFMGKKIIYILYILPMVLSICGTTLATYTLLDGWNLIGNFTSMMLLSCGGTGMNFLLVHALFVNVSDTYMEAAEIDGAGYFTIFFRVMLPHAMGLVGTLWIMGFIGQWNDYASVRLFLGIEPEYATIATGLQYLYVQVTSTGNPQYTNNYPMYYAAVIITVIPMIVLFLCFQKQIMKLSLGGGIKE